MGPSGIQVGGESCIRGKAVKGILKGTFPIVRCMTKNRPTPRGGPEIMKGP
jgi:hypothetical protein